MALDVYLPFKYHQLTFTIVLKKPIRKPILERVWSSRTWHRVRPETDIAGVYNKQQKWTIIRIRIRETNLESMKRRSKGSAMQTQINRENLTRTVRLRVAEQQSESKNISSAKFCGYQSAKLWEKSLVFKSGRTNKDFRPAQYTTSPDIAYYRWISTRSASCRQSVSRIAPRRSSMADMAILGRM